MPYKGLSLDTIDPSFLTNVPQSQKKRRGVLKCLFVVGNAKQCLLLRVNRTGSCKTMENASAAEA